ncbi:MAG: cytochrome c3 family protein, partial [Deltaproteobacteria bacterium]|nr:cytochrome c3 family protein [Deltaproteobacteria bacterium]
MNRSSYWIIGVVVGIVSLFVAAGIYAGTEVPEVIKLKEKAYKKHKYAIVKFSHKTHQEDYPEKYPEFFSSKCGECHHDKDNKPLVNLKPGDEVKRCIECHKKPAYITGKKAKGLSKKQKRE